MQSVQHRLSSVSTLITFCLCRLQLLQDDDSDDEAELKAELERIRAERAAEAEKRAAEEEAKRQEAIRAEVLGGNPLMANGEVDFGVKRRCV